MRLTDDEVPVDEELVRTLLRSELPELAELPVADVGGGTDNRMFRVGVSHVARFPRAPGKVSALEKELRWLPRLKPHLALPVPVPVLRGHPTQAHPLPWALLEWLDGDPGGSAAVEDWESFGSQVAAFVDSLHATELMGARRDGDLDWYRGGSLRPLAPRVAASFAGVRAAGLDLDVDRLEGLWRRSLDLPDPVAPYVWLHGDLRPANLLTNGGRLSAVIDFGALSVGWPDVEHVVAWDMPPVGRAAYRATLGVDALTWARARAWAVALSIGGVADYRVRLPSLAGESVRRLRQVLEDMGEDEGAQL